MVISLKFQSTATAFFFGNKKKFYTNQGEINKVTVWKSAFSQGLVIPLKHGHVNWA